MTMHYELKGRHKVCFKAKIGLSIANSIVNGQSTCRKLDRTLSILVDPHHRVVYGMCGDHLKYTLETLGLYGSAGQSPWPNLRAGAVVANIGWTPALWQKRRWIAAFAQIRRSQSCLWAIFELNAKSDPSPITNWLFLYFTYWTSVQRRGKKHRLVVEVESLARRRREGRRRRKKWRKSSKFQQKFVSFTYSNNAHRNSGCTLHISDKMWKCTSD